MGYTNFKNSYLFNRKELEDAPHINENGLTRTISLWWVYLQILGPIFLNSSICIGHKDSTLKGAKYHVTLCISSKVKGFNGPHQRHGGFNGIHIHILNINKEEFSTIYSSYQGYQGPQHHQGVGVPRLLPRYHDLIKKTNDHIMGHLEYLNLYTYLTHQVLFLGYYGIGCGTGKP